MTVSSRPEAVVSRMEPGHWESDAMVCLASKAALYALVERSSRMTFLTKLPGKTASQTSKSIIERLKPLDPKLRRRLPMTADRRTPITRR